MKRIVLQSLGLGLVVVLLLAACAPAATPAVEPTKMPEEA